MVQNGQRDDGKQLINKLTLLINIYKPEFFGLNEVLINTKTQESPVISFLENNGYNVHFTPFSPLSKVWMIGSLLASKQQPLSIREHIQGPDTQAARRGYKGFSVKTIEGKFKFDGEDLYVVVNYLGNLIPLDWGTHITHRRNFNRFLKTIGSKNIIIGGDFNEPKYMWTWLGLNKRLKRKTGNLWNPTWRLNGKLRNIFFANYDYILYSSKNLSLTNFNVADRQPSDHAPIVGEFTFKTATPRV